MRLIGLSSGRGWLTTMTIGFFLAGLISSGSGLYIQAKAVVAQHLLERAWHLHQVTGSARKPWPWADIRAFAKLEVDAASTEFIVLDDANPEALAFGPGWIAGSARHPSHGTIALGGHRDTHLAFMQQAEVGDELTLETADGQRFHYRVISRQVVDTSAEPLAIDMSQKALVLVTCYPFNALQPGGPMRLMVTALPTHLKPSI